MKQTSEEFCSHCFLRPIQMINLHMNDSWSEVEKLINFMKCKKVVFSTWSLVGETECVLV